MSRYRVEDDAAHICCNAASVVDTARPVMVLGHHYEHQYETMCECVDGELAQKICDALNAAEGE